MSLNEMLKRKRQDILEVAHDYGVTNVRVFGSVARGDEGPQSDIDLIVELEREWSLLDHIGFVHALEDLLDCKVDVVVEAGLRDIVRERVLDEAIPL